MNYWPIIPMLVLCSQVNAQLEIPVPILFNGAEAEQRQLTGLAYPADSSAGVSLEVARSRALITGTTTGQTVLNVELYPPLSTIPAGMELTLIPGEAHGANPQVTVNGTGPYELVKQGPLPLDSAELPLGVPANFVFDGTRFQLISGSSRPCPMGFTAATHALCIQDSSYNAVNFRTAAGACITAGGRLCSISDWMVACHRIDGFLSSVVDLEWVDHAANSQTQAKLVGVDRLTQAFGCDFGDTDDHTFPHRYRCCANR